MKKLISQNLTNKTLSNPFSSTKRVLPIVFIMIFSCFLVTAFDFDNVKSYDPSKKEITITNAFGLGEDIAKIKLESELIVYVIPGKDRKVAEISFYDFDKNYDNILKEMEFYNVKTSQKFSRSFTYKYKKVVGTKKTPIYAKQCSSYLNGSDYCNNVLKDYREEDIIEWTPFQNLKDADGEKVTIGIFTNVYPEDNMEWIPTYFGVRIDEWATWTASFDVDLVAYYNFEQSSGDLLDVANDHDGTVTIAGDLVRGVSGVIGDAWTLNSSVINVTAGATEFNFTNQNFSISAWINPEAGAALDSVINHQDSGKAAFLFDLNPSTGFAITIFNGSGTGVTSTAIPVSYDVWNHVVITTNGTRVLIYLNGTLADNDAWDGTITSLPGDLMIGSSYAGAVPLEGELDEVAIWNRTLTTSEITDLWNGGAGIGKSFVGVLTIVLNTPTNDTSFVANSREFNATLTPNSVNLTNATFDIWFNNGTLFNSTTTTVTGNDTNQSLFTLLEIPVNNFKWNVLGCGINSSSGVICDVQDNNFTFTRSSFSETGTHYNLNVTETNNETFQLNISSISSIILYSADLLYNGTYFPVEFTNNGGGNYTIEAVIDIPTLNVSTQERSFSWDLTFDVGGGFSNGTTTTNWQNASISNITITGTTIALNFSVFDEETLAPLYVDFDMTAEWYLGSGSNTKSQAFDRPANHEFNFYVTPEGNAHYTDVSLSVLNDTTNTSAGGSYVARNFDFRLLRLINTTTTHRRLLLLNSSDSKNVIVSLKDVGLRPLEDYIIQIERYYPGENLYRIVESQRTDIFGQIVTRLVENEVKYRFKFYDEDNTLVKTVSNTVIACKATICKVQFIIEDDTDIFSDFDDITNHFYNFTFNNNTNIFTVVWNDRTGQSQIHRLEVKRQAFNGTTSICNSTSSLDTGILNCGVGDSRASYQGQFFRRVGIRETKLQVIGVDVGNLSDTWGLEGVLWSFVILSACLLIGVFYPPVGIVLYLAGIFLLGTLDIIYINPAIIIAQIVIGGIVIWAFRG